MLLSQLKRFEVGVESNSATAQAVGAGTGSHDGLLHWARAAHEHSHALQWWIVVLRGFTVVMEVPLDDFKDPVQIRSSLMKRKGVMLPFILLFLVISMILFGHVFLLLVAGRC